MPLRIRIVNMNDLPALQELYLNLQNIEIEPLTSDKLKVWESILKDPDYYILVGEENGELVSSLTLVIIKNLTRNMQPYALIENIVTAENQRNKGYAGALLNRAVEIAKESGCFKAMLMSGSQNESTINFYKRAGFSNDGKSAFVHYLSE